MTTPKYYDDIYNRIIAERGLSGDWIDERHTEVLKYVVGTVLDLGCGLGEMANLIGGVRYFGVDFSPSAIAYARRACKNPHAYFKCGDLYAIEPMIVHDTVLMLELLEHVKEHKPLVDYALAHAGKRVIVTVPRDMPGRAHLHPKWDKPKLQALLGGDIDAHLFGGDKADRWWIAIKEMR